MKLGGNRSGSLVDELAAEAAPAVHAPGAWDDEDDGDLMDVTADGGDWSMFYFLILREHIPEAVK